MDVKRQRLAGLSIEEVVLPLQMDRPRSACFAEGTANALPGLAGLTFLAALLFFQPLHRGQKPGGFRLAE